MKVVGKKIYNSNKTEDQTSVKKNASSARVTNSHCLSPSHYSKMEPKTSQLPFGATKSPHFGQVWPLTNFLC